MCGISGVAYSECGRMVERSMLQRMTDVIRHRGPDGEGFFLAPGVGLAMCRLSIIDLMNGDQPLYNEDQSMAVICNGEIYNYVELREALIQKGHRFATQSDVEVIAHLYEEHGTDCLPFLRGMFAFALWDKRRQRLFLARDRLGIKPLCYTIARDRTIYFCSEIKSLLAAGVVASQINPKAVADLFQFGFILSPQTMFRSVKRLLPGHYLLYEGGKVQIRRYWDLNFGGLNLEESTFTEIQWADALHDKFEEAIRLHLRSDVPVSGWLSPGIDSSAVVAFMRKQSSSPVQTYSMVIEGQPWDEVSTRPTLDKFPGFELPNRRLVCRNKDLSHYPLAVWHEEYPDTSGLHILQMMLARDTAAKSKVVLTGEGADEIFGGYPWFRFDKLSQPFAWLPVPIRRLMLLGPVLPRWKPWASQVFLARRPIGLKSYADLISIQSPRLTGRILTPEFRDAMKPSGRAAVVDLHDKAIEELSAFERIQYLELKTRMVDWILHGLDRISMAHSLEVRVPFLDHELVELACRIPSSYKMRYLKEKHVFRMAMKGHLPKAILKRKKYGFRAPTVRWLRGPLPEFAEELLAAHAIKKKGYFNPDTVSQILAQHRSGKADYAKPLMIVLGVQLWHQLFVEDFRPEF